MSLQKETACHYYAYALHVGRGSGDRCGDHFRELQKMQGANARKLAQITGIVRVGPM